MNITVAEAGMLLFLLFIYNLALVFSGVWAYRKGLQDRMSIEKGQTLKPICSPLKVKAHLIAKFKDAKETEAAKEQPDPQDELLKGYANMMAYDGDLPKEKR